MLDYTVVSVEEADLPELGRHEPWHRYVIASSLHTIVGYHRGTREESEAYAEQCVRRLNDRHRTRSFTGGYPASCQTAP